MVVSDQSISCMFVSRRCSYNLCVCVFVCVCVCVCVCFFLSVGNAANSSLFIVFLWYFPCGSGSLIFVRLLGAFVGGGLYIWGKFTCMWMVDISGES